MSAFKTSLLAVIGVLTAAEADADKAGDKHNHQAGIRTRKALEAGIHQAHQLRKDIQAAFPHHIPVDPTPAPSPAPAPVDPTPAPAPVDPTPAPAPVDPTPAPVDPMPAPAPVDPTPAV